MNSDVDGEETYAKMRETLDKPPTGSDMVAGWEGQRPAPIEYPSSCVLIHFHPHSHKRDLKNWAGSGSINPRG